MYGAPARRLYVLELADGIVKGGIARGDGTERIRQHAAKLTVVQHRISSKYVEVAGERALLDRLARIGALVRGREWFSGVTFAQAVQVLEEISEQFAHADQAPVPSPRLRVTRGGLSLNDKEMAVIDAYCAHTGLERAVACRQLLLDAIVGAAGGSHAADSLARH